MTLTGHSALAMTQSGHDVNKIPELIAQKNAVLARGDGMYELPTANQPSANMVDAGIQGKVEGTEQCKGDVQSGSVDIEPIYADVRGCRGSERDGLQHAGIC